MALHNTSYFLYCETSVHAGDGTSSGTIDNPIQRERTTNFPNFRDSTLRGAVREYFEKNVREEGNLFTPTFGSKENGNKKSALSVYPARILFFPVRSFKGVFGYITCPFVLERFQQEMKLFHNVDIFKEFPIPSVSDERVATTAGLVIGDTGKVGFEEFLFTKTDDDIPDLSNLLGINRLKDKTAIVSNTVFKYFVKIYTEKITRNKIKIETGTAEGTGLFNVEYLPEESMLYTTFGFSNEFPEKKEDKEFKKDDEIQKYFEKNFNEMYKLGGDKSIGKGLVTPTKIEFSKTKKDGK